MGNDAGILAVTGSLIDHNYLNEDRVNYSGNLKVLSV